jgi:hypothetical protein
MKYLEDKNAKSRKLVADLSLHREILLGRRCRGL